MNTFRRAISSTIVLATLGFLASCGRAPKAEAPSSDTAPALAAPTSNQAPQEEAEVEPATLADAEALLEKFRADLDRLALNEPVAPSAAAGGAPPPPVSARPAPAPARDDAKRAEKSAAAEGAAAPTKEANACETACKAFSSLSRASDAVCRLDIDGGKRCERARQIRQGASQRVTSCGCAK